MQLNKMFYDDHRRLFDGIKFDEIQAYAIGGSKKVDTFRLPELGLSFQRGAIQLRNVPVLNTPSVFDVRGNIGSAGRSLWHDYSSATIDFRRKLLLLN